MKKFIIFLIAALFFTVYANSQNTTILCGTEFSDDVVINKNTSVLTIHHAFDVTIDLKSNINHISYYDPTTNVVRIIYSEGEDESMIWVLSIFKDLSTGRWWYEYHNMEAGIVLYKGDKSLWDNYTEPALITKKTKRT